MTLPSVLDLTFIDGDLDAGQVGGDLAWNAPLDTSQVTQYFIYLAADTLGSKRSLILDTPLGTNKVRVPLDTMLPWACIKVAGWVHPSVHQLGHSTHSLRIQSFPKQFHCRASDGLV